MLKPSYAELMDVLNQNSNESDEVTSRYTIVIAAAKRARQIIEGDEAMTKAIAGKPLSTAVNEILNNKIKIVPEGEGTVLFLDKQIDTKNKKEKVDFSDIEKFEEKEQLEDEDIDVIEEDDIELDIVVEGDEEL